MVAGQLIVWQVVAGQLIVGQVVAGQAIKLNRWILQFMVSSLQEN